MRAFIALELPPRFADEVAGVARQLALTIDGRFMPRENHHLTLAFLGDVCEAEASAAVAVVEKACARADGPVPLRCVGLGSFGKPTDATLWLGIDADPTLLDLVRRVRDGLDDAGIAYDAKPFKPHITLARRARLPRGTSLPALPFPNADTANTVTLFKSTLSSEGASYKALFRAELG